MYGEGSQQASLLFFSWPLWISPSPLPRGKAVAPDDIMGPRCLTSEQPSMAARIRSPSSPLPSTRHVPIPLPRLGGVVGGAWATSPRPMGLGSLGGWGGPLPGNEFLA